MKQPLHEDEATPSVTTTNIHPSHIVAPVLWDVEEENFRALREEPTSSLVVAPGVDRWF